MSRTKSASLLALLFCSVSLTVGNSIAQPASVNAQESPSVKTLPSKRLAKSLKALRSSDHPKRVRAVGELADLGPGALPALAAAHAEAATAGINGYQSMIGAARSRIALEHPESVPFLLEDLLSPLPNVGPAAVHMLGLAPAEVLPVLLERLDHMDNAVREGVVTAIGLHGSDAVVAIPKLIELLDNDSAEYVRWRAVWALGMIEPDQPDVVAAVRRALRDDAASVRFTALWVMTRQGAAGLAGLIQALDSDELRPAASPLLARLGNQANTLVLKRLEDDVEPEVLVHCLRIIGAVGAGDDASRQVVLSHLRHESKELRSEALLALPGSLEDPASILPFLSTGLADDAPSVRVTAAEVASTLGTAAVSLAPELLGAWRAAAKEELSTEAFAHALIESEATGPELLEALLDLAEDDETKGDTTASVVLFRTPEETYDAVSNRLGTVDEGKLSAYCMILGGLGCRGVPELIDLSENESSEVRGRAIRALGLTACSEPEVLEVLRTAWRDPDMQSDVAFALLWLGEEEGGLREAALRSLDELSRGTQAMIIRGLASFNPDAPGLLTKIASLALTSRSGEIRLAATAALGAGTQGRAQRVDTLRSVLGQRGQYRRRSDQTPYDQLKTSASTIKIQSAAILALRELGDPSTKTMEVVAVHTRHPHASVRVLAASTLKDFGESAAFTSIEMSGHFQSDHYAVRAASLLATNSFGPGIEDITTSLGIGVTDANGELAHLAGVSLSHIGPASRLVLADILFALLYEDFNPVMWTRDRQDGALAPGVWVTKSLEQSFPATRCLMATLLGEIGAAHPEDAEIIRPFLKRTSMDPDQELAAASRAALDRF